MRKAPLVSICIPVYNGAKFLHETIESVLAQDFTDYEILMIDDQSTDDSASIISAYSREDSRIVIHRNQRRLGLVGNWNECIKKARGEWIKFIFQDDLLAPDCLSKMIRFIMTSQPNEEVVFCRRAFFFDRAGSQTEFETKMRRRQFIWDLYPDMTRITPTDTAKIIAKWAARNMFGEPSSFLIHRNVFKQLGLFNDSFHHICDLEYWFRIGVNMPMLLIPETLVYFRVHDQSTTSYNRQEKWLQMRYLDRLRLFGKFLHDRHYRPLRNEMATWPCNWFLKTQTAIYVRRAKLEVDAAKDARWHDEYDAFCKEYRHIVASADSNYLMLAMRFMASKYSLKIKWTIDSWLGNQHKKSLQNVNLMNLNKS